MEALTVILQHPCAVKDQQLICHLLSVSSSVRSLVVAHCNGQVIVTYKVTALSQLKMFCSWLQLHGSLLRKLKLDLRLLQSGNAVITHGLAQGCTETAGLAIAEAICQGATAGAAGRTGLHIQHFCSTYVTARMLQELPPGCLTRLELDALPDNDSIAATIGHPIAQFTQLRSLSLGVGYIESIIPAISKLTKLSSLRLGRVKHSLVKLPPSLVQLTAVVNRPDICHATTFNLQLQHLTVLTALDLHVPAGLVCEGFGLLALWYGDKLPTSLKTLKLNDCESMEPLLQLQQLQRLQMTASSTTAAVLLQLTALTVLTHIALQYSSSKRAGRAATAWGNLPIGHLSFVQGSSYSRYQWQLSTLQQLVSMKSSLTRLSLTAKTAYDASPQQLASILAQLKSLQKVRVSNLQFGRKQHKAIDPGHSAVLEALAGLTSLKTLKFCSNHHSLNQAALQRLVAATQLTQLQLIDTANVDDSTLSMLASGLTGLKQLVLAGTSDVQECVVPVFGSQLSHGQRLHVASMPPNSNILTQCYQQYGVHIQPVGYEDLALSGSEGSAVIDVPSDQEGWDEELD